MIIENTGLNGLENELEVLDEAAEKVGFIRWQWEYTRATYDHKIEDSASGSEYFVRITTRAIEGKLESPHAVLKIESVYIGRSTFPHGLDYESPIPTPVMKQALERAEQLKQLLA